MNPIILDVPPINPPVKKVKHKFVPKEPIPSLEAPEPISWANVAAKEYQMDICLLCNAPLANEDLSLLKYDYDFYKSNLELLEDVEPNFLVRNCRATAKTLKEALFANVIHYGGYGVPQSVGLELDDGRLHGLSEEERMDFRQMYMAHHGIDGSESLEGKSINQIVVVATENSYLSAKFFLECGFVHVIAFRPRPDGVSKQQYRQQIKQFCSLFYDAMNNLSSDEGSSEQSEDETTLLDLVTKLGASQWPNNPNQVMILPTEKQLDELVEIYDDAAEDLYG
eukprot:TRINITY_DN8664_c0_g1_i1.p1 TRINITY_DN8664_c0_g1~~TRINITY_DN8664_c0_g1_i1.p1  ORF type:complete len:281 (-),score=98.02 TRINITY_DN8664_c0_g1_i1:3-845(-)